MVLHVQDQWIEVVRMATFVYQRKA